MTPSNALPTLLLALIIGCSKCQAFVSPSPSSSAVAPPRASAVIVRRIDHEQPSRRRNRAAGGVVGRRISKFESSSNSSPTALFNGVIIDVPDNFFTIAFFSIGLFYSLGKAYNRYLLEELAFERRRYESRERKLGEDPTLDEFELRREESASWPSVYARTLRGEGEPAASAAGEGGEASSRGRRSRAAKTTTLDRDEFDAAMAGMTDEEISSFESRYGIEYDPYYDEPYDESELPAGKYKEDKSYGDRRYANGEVFYKDEATGKFYRQGSRPRQRKFWDLNSS